MVRKKTTSDQSSIVRSLDVADCGCPYEWTDDGHLVPCPHLQTAVAEHGLTIDEWAELLRDVDGKQFTGRRLPREPCPYSPGTTEKYETILERARRGEHVHHPDDRKKDAPKRGTRLKTSGANTLEQTWTVDDHDNTAAVKPPREKDPDEIAWQSMRACAARLGLPDPGETSPTVAGPRLYIPDDEEEGCDLDTAED